METINTVPGGDGAELIKDETPPRKLPKAADRDNGDMEEDDDDIDETLTERLVGLTEMFPESVRNIAYSTCSFSISATKGFYHVARIGIWVAASSACILALPIMFETERAQMEDMQRQQQRELMLGPNAASVGQ